MVIDNFFMRTQCQPHCLLNDEYILTRTQWQEYCLETVSQQGNFFAYLKLFPSERKRLEKMGFTIIPMNQGNMDVICMVHFLHAFKEGIPPIIFDYLLGVVNSKPKLENLAQELFTVAYKEVYLK